MAISPNQKKTVEDIVRRAAKDSKFHDRVRLNLDRILRDEYSLSGQTEEIRKLLPKEFFNKELSEKDLKTIAGGFSIGSMVSGAFHDVENAGKDIVDGVEDAGKAIGGAVKDVAVGAYDVGKDVVEGGATAAKDLFTGKIGDAAKALVNVPVAASKDAVKGVVGGAEALGTGVVNVAGDTAKFAVDSSGLGVLGGALGITPKVDGLIDGMTSGLNKGVTGVGQLAQDAADASIDFTNMPATALAQSFDDATHGQWGKALTDPVTVPLSTFGKDGKQIFSDAANPNTIMGLLTVAGIAATPFTGGLSDAAVIGADAAVEGGALTADVGDSLEGVSNLFKEPETSAAQKGVTQTVREGLSSARTTAGNLASRATGAVQSAASDAASAAGRAATSISDTASSALKTASELPGKAATAAKNFLGVGKAAAQDVEMTNFAEDELTPMTEAELAEERAAEAANANKAGQVASKAADATQAATKTADAAKTAEPAAGRLSQIKDAVLSKKGLAIGGGATALAAGALVLPKILSSAKGAEASQAGTSTEATGASSSAGTQAAGASATTQVGSAPPALMNGLSTLQATLSDPRIGQLAQAIDQQAGTQNTYQNMSQLAQNTTAVLQDPTPANVAQLSSQLQQVYQSLQSIQGDASTQMQNLLSQLYNELNPPTA